MVFLLFLLFSPSPPFAEETYALPKEAEEVLQKAAALESYRAKFLLEAKEQDGQTFRLQGTLLFQNPQRRRLEIREGDAEQPSQILVADGTVEWQYYPEDGIVYRVLDPPPPPGPHQPFAEALPDTLRFVRRLEEGKERRLRFEAQPLPSTVEGAPIAIQTVGIEVGEQDGLARRLELLDAQGQPVLTQSFTEVEVNVAVDKGQFVFVPQEGMAVVDVSPPEPASTQEATPQ